MFILLPIAVPIILGLLMLKLKIEDSKTRKNYLLVSTSATLILTFISNIYFADQTHVIASFPMNIDMALNIDALSILFSSLFVIIWILVTIYSFDYMSHLGHENRFYAFFLATLGALIGISYADNLVTLYMFFETLSLCSYILVIHERTHESFIAGRKYIYYSLFGASCGLIGIFYLYSLGIDTSFTQGGIEGIVCSNELLFYTVLGVVGFGCKAGMFPLHGWLAVAHPIAPAPASAILSGLATKAGIIAIIRILYYTIGTDILMGTWAQYFILVLSMITIFMGSMLACRENVLKKRLAYSTVSQVSYIIFGLFLFHKIGFIGALLQVVFHALAKTLLFLDAGTIIHTTHITLCNQLGGLGGRLKYVFILYTIGGLSLVGIPFTAGFVSKWYIAQGALTQDNLTLGFIGVCVIMISAALTALYLLGTTAIAFFGTEDNISQENYNVSHTMMAPMIILALAIVALGIFPAPLLSFLNTLADAVIL